MPATIEKKTRLEELKQAKLKSVQKTIGLILTNPIVKVYFSQDHTIELIAVNTDEELTSEPIRALVDYSEMLHKTLHIKRSGSGISIKIK